MNGNRAAAEDRNYLSDRMIAARLRRRLAGIMSLDVVGYSRMMSLDEADTHRRVKGVIDALAIPLIASCGGRVFKKTGDGVLADFDSIVQATICAVVIQQEMRDRSAEEAAVQFRIAVHFGEVIVEPDDLYGEAINLTVRLEGLAEPGGICASADVLHQVTPQLPLEFASLGPQRLKNIPRPVEAFRVLLPQEPFAAVRMQRALRAARAPKPLVAKPAIAVLPFRDLHKGGGLDFLAAGLTDELITRLAQARAFPVISRSSAFNLKGDFDPAVMGASLGALYALSGTVRRDGATVRVAARLVDTSSGETLFAERYDRIATDLFSVQDDIAVSVVGAISPELTARESERFASRPTISLDAYGLCQRAIWHHNRYTAADFAAAESFFRAALEADPDYGAAAAGLSIALVHATMSGWTDVGRFAEAEQLALDAVAADSRDPQGHFALGIARYHLGKTRAALADLEHAIACNPSHAAAYANIAFLSNYLDQPDRALANAQLAFRLSPTDPRLFIWSTALAAAYFLGGDYEAAVTSGERGLGMRPDYPHSIRYIAAALGELGRKEEAADYVAALRRLDGSLSQTEALLGKVYAGSALERILAGLGKAGFE